MAILKAPCLSLGASGQLAKTLVFFGWKGLNVVREYVIPANPDTTLQQTQRSYMTDAVALIHTAQANATNPLEEVDQTAYAALASAKGKIMTWFNQAAKLYLDVIRAGEVPIVYSGGDVSNTLTTSIYAILYLNEQTGSQLAAGTFFLGTSKTNLIHSTAATISVLNHARINNTDLSAILTAGVKYYWQFRPDSGDPCEGANSGIYYFVAT